MHKTQETVTQSRFSDTKHFIPNPVSITSTLISYRLWNTSGVRLWKTCSCQRYRLYLECDAKCGHESLWNNSPSMRKRLLPSSLMLRCLLFALYTFFCFFRFYYFRLVWTLCTMFIKISKYIMIYRHWVIISSTASSNWYSNQHRLYAQSWLLCPL